MGGQRSTFRGPMVLDLGGQWSGANGLGGQSSIYPWPWAEAVAEHYHHYT